jgi:peptidoglycan/LPS O-acetylase OafA/YrhL
MAIDCSDAKVRVGLRVIALVTGQTRNVISNLLLDLRNMSAIVQTGPATIKQNSVTGSGRSSLLVANLYAWVLLRLSRKTTSGSFIPQMDGLRFIAITMVILFHLNAYLTGKTTFYAHTAPHCDWLTRIALAGRHGVELFFAISGFILALPFAARYLTGAPAVNLRSYYLRRLTRLEPPYIVTLCAFAILGILIHPGAAPRFGAHFIASLFYLHNLIYAAPSTALGVAWSLEIEVQFYLLVPLLTLLFAVRNSVKRRLLMVGLIVLMEAAQTKLLLLSPRFGLSIFSYLQFFLVGFLLADIILLEWKTPARNFYWDIVAIAGWPVMYFCLQSDELTQWLFPPVIFVIYCAAFRGGWFSMMLSSRRITIIGGMCYSIYLIHYEVISAVGRFTKIIGTGLPDPIYLALQLAFVGVVIMFLCGLYFLLLEGPCMQRDWPQKLRQRVKGWLPSKPVKAEAAFAD